MLKLNATIKLMMTISMIKGTAAEIATQIQTVFEVSGLPDLTIVSFIR